MPRGLDHVVHAVRDLDAAADLYRRLGFTVGARNIHPPAWGTQNHVVQLPGFFVELLGLGDMRAVSEHAASFFSFGAYNRDFLARQKGLSMLALESTDAASDNEAFTAAGIGGFRTFDFEREATRPDGSRVKVAFSLAFARDDKARDIGFFASQHRAPENFWDSAMQRHANTVSGIAGVVLVAENPTDHHIFLSAFVGERDLQASSAGISVATPRGDIQVMDETAFRGHYGAEPPDLSGGARLAALRFRVGDPAAVAARLQAGGIDASDHRGRLVVAPRDAMGATLVFE